MDRVHLAAELSPDSLRGVGVGVYQSTKHIGVLCRDSFDKRVLLLHLAFHEDLREEQDTTKCFLWIEAKVEEEQAKVIAAQARLIYRKNGLQGVPYGCSPYGVYFG